MGGGEFRGAFDALLSSLFIDHRCIEGVGGGLPLSLPYR